MAFYVRLISFSTGRSECIECNPAQYMNNSGMEYFDTKCWNHSYIRIPSSGVAAPYRRLYSVSVAERDPLLLGAVVRYRKNYPNIPIKVVDRKKKTLLYDGSPFHCPKELESRRVVHTNYTGKLLSMEVD